MKKKFLAALLVAAMGTTLLAGCGNATADTDNSTGSDTQTSDATAADDTAEDTASEVVLDGSYPEETIKIGVVGYDSTSEQQNGMDAYFSYLEEYYNIEFQWSDDLADAAGELDFIAQCAANGCQGIIGYYNEALDQAATTAAEYGMYYWGGFGGNEDAYNAVKDNEYYLGGYTLGDAEYEAGYSMAQALIDQGCKKICLCTGGEAFGVDMFMDRCAGFRDAIAEADDVEIVYEVEGWPGTDSFSAGQTAALGMDIDAIASTFDVAMWFQPVMESSLADTVKLAAIGEVSDTYYEFFNSGLVSCIVYDNEEVVFGNAVPMIINAVEGNKLTDADGNAPLFTVHRWTVTNVDEFNAIYDLHNNGGWVITAEDMWNNAIVDSGNGVTYDSFAEYYGSFTIDSIQ